MLCDAVENARNAQAVFFRNVFQQRWIPVLSECNAELATETPFFSQNKKWIIALRCRIHYEWYRLGKDLVLSKPCDATWPMQITVFKSEVLRVIQSINDDFKIQVAAEWVYKDMFEVFIIRRDSLDFFEVRAQYRPSQVIGIDQFVLLWSNAE